MTVVVQLGHFLSAVFSDTVSATENVTNIQSDVTVAGQTGCAIQSDLVMTFNR